MRARGFTLIEVLVATAILVTVAAGTAQLLAVAIRHGAASRQQLAMSIAASRKIDEIAEMVRGGPAPPASIGAVDVAVGGYSDITSEAGARIERRWLIAPLPDYSATAVVIVVRLIPVARHAAAGIDVVTMREAGRP